MIEFNETYIDSIKKRTIEKDGFCVLYNPQYVINNAYKNDVLHQLPPDYVFIDYVYKINNVALSTFHRDVTSSQHNYNTDYPVYTAILYKYSGDLLSICPNSNQDYPLCFSHIYNISGEPGTVFLFDCDTLHAGQINNCKEREVIQFKICHKTDLSKLKHLQGINTEKTDICTMSYYNSIMRKLSYYFEFPINYMFYPIMIKRENKNNLIGFIQNFIPLSYYNNSY
jgi:hypothetical protein